MNGYESQACIEGKKEELLETEKACNRSSKSRFKKEGMVSSGIYKRGVK